MARIKGHRPVRTCIVCRKKRYKYDLARICMKDGRAVVDEAQKMQQRGAYACPDGECLVLALENYRRCLDRAF